MPLATGWFCWCALRGELLHRGASLWAEMCPPFRGLSPQLLQCEHPLAVGNWGPGREDVPKQPLRAWIWGAASRDSHLGGHYQQGTHAVGKDKKEER